MEPVTWAWSNAEKIGVVFLLLLAIVAFVKGWVVTKHEYDRVMKEYETHRAMNERLLGQLERAVTVAEVSVTRKQDADNVADKLTKLDSMFRKNSTP